MSSYSPWNEALASRFFSTEMAGRNVHLYMNKELIKEIEKAMPEVGTFRDAVAGLPTAPMTNGERVCKRAYREFRHWRQRREGYPPYIGYLCFFVLASGTDGDFAPHAYYPRLWALLKYEHRTGPVPGFNQMRELWDDLENWSVYDKQGELGIFQSRSVGGHVHIGYPLSQALLVEKERQALPHVFYHAGLDPSSSHPPSEIALSLRSNIARQFMRARTVHMAERPHDELHKALIEAVSEELVDWDGTVPELDLGKTRQILAGLRICIELDRVTKTVKSSIRCKLNHEFPETGIILENGLRADEGVSGWSLPIEWANTGESFDASQLDWREGTTMWSKSTGYQLRLKGYPVRIFDSGRPEGISGLIDTHTLPKGRPFFLCYPESAWPHLERWATTQCQEFENLDIVQGLPKSWQLASVAAAINDEAVKGSFSILTFQSGLRLQLVGGIRSSKGNNFFDFAPPSVRLTGDPPDTEVLYDKIPLSSPASDNVFLLPDNLPNGSRITVEARSGSSILRSQTFFLTGDFKLPSGEPELCLDFAGNSVQLDDGKVCIAGAYIEVPKPDFAALAADLFEDLEHGMGGMKGFLVGRLPGQIVAWPSEPFPRDWIPAWAITSYRRKKWKAVYIGEILGVTSPTTPNTPALRKVKRWKKVIWHWRKRILLPQHPEERAMWREIQEESRHV